MPDSVSITLKGQSIGLSDLSDALVELATVLAEVDQQVTGSTKHRLEGGPARTFQRDGGRRTGVPSESGVRPTGTGDRGVCRRASGPTGKTGPPGAFQRQGVASAKRLARHVNGEVTAIVMTGAVENEPVKRVSFGSRMAAHVDEIIGVSGHATGALEGRLETITIQRTERVHHLRSAQAAWDALHLRSRHARRHPGTAGAQSSRVRRHRLQQGRGTDHNSGRAIPTPAGSRRIASAA